MPALNGQTVVVIGGSAGIGLETARLARAEGAELFVGGTGARRPGLGLVVTSAVSVALPALIAGMALEIAPYGST